ncbi:MAG: TIR domain-containing protein [Lachnospiraceae bacterium]|nr:TIR domain-containing protein [Lachnospiraceae bacterium]
MTMAYRNKTYIAFDGDNDMRYYTLMKAWKQSDNTNFQFYDAHDLNTARDSSQTESIKKQLAIRMANSKIFVLLLGEKTKYLTRFVKWEVEHAIRLDLPIIVVNLNGEKGVDSKRMPMWLTGHLCVSCSFNSKILQYSLEKWAIWHDKYKRISEKKDKHFFWTSDVYSKLGL